jgi:hypothetical protein
LRTAFDRGEKAFAGLADGVFGPPKAFARVADGVFGPPKAFARVADGSGGSDVPSRARSVV